MGIRGKELVFWDNDWERTERRLLAESKRMIAVYALLGGQYKLYQHLKKKAGMNICKVWIGGNGPHDMCLSQSVEGDFRTWRVGWGFGEFGFL